MDGRGLAVVLGLAAAGVAVAGATCGSTVLVRGRVKQRFRARLTRYWIADLTPGEFPIQDPSGTVLSWVSGDSLSRLLMEGTGELPDGRRVNYVDGKRWRLVPAGIWGYGVGGRKLVPFQSVAVDRALIPLDSLCYLIELRRWVRAVDVGDLIKGQHLDLFVGRAGAAKGNDALDYCTVEVYG
jgi:3D (Asp-Asp-Asp) domain-containing protein